MATPAPVKVPLDVPIAVVNRAEIEAWRDRVTAALTEYHDAVSTLLAVIEEGVHLDLVVG
jgi:hypothetical protein